MTFASFLQEGLIKLPTKALHEMLSFFMETYLAYLLFHLDDLHVDKDSKKEAQQLMRSMLAHLAREHHVRLPKARAVKLAHRKVAVKDLPEAYLRRVLKKVGEKEHAKLLHLVLKLTVTFIDHPDRAADDDAIYIDKRKEIVISIRGLGLTIDAVGELL